MIEDHSLEFQTSFLTGETTAWCSCGWDSGPVVDQETAAEKWSFHCDDVFMQATERFMEGRGESEWAR